MPPTLRTKNSSPKKASFSVPNSFQNLPARMAQKFGRWVKISPFVKIAFLIPFNQIWPTSTKTCENSRFLMFHIGKILKTKHLKFRSFLGKLCQNSATDLYGRLHFYSALLSYAAEESASWKHWTIYGWTGKKFGWWKKYIPRKKNHICND